MSSAACSVHLEASQSVYHTVHRLIKVQIKIPEESFFFCGLMFCVPFISDCVVGNTLLHLISMQLVDKTTSKCLKLNPYSILTLEEITKCNVKGVTHTEEPEYHKNQQASVKNI